MFCLEIVFKFCLSDDHVGEKQSNGRENEVSVSNAVDSGFNSMLGQSNDFKIGIQIFPVRRSALNGQCREEAGKFACSVPLGKTLSGIPHFRVQHKCPTTPNRGRYSVFLVIRK